MKIDLTLIILIACLATSSATLRLLKSKLKPAPISRYRAVKYLSQPLVIPEPVPATYARPVSTYSAHVSTYAVSSPSLATYAAPVAVYAQPLTVTYDAHPIVNFVEHRPVYFETISPFGAHFAEEHFSHYDEDYAKR